MFASVLFYDRLMKKNELTSFLLKTNIQKLDNLATVIQNAIVPKRWQ